VLGLYLEGVMVFRVSRQAVFCFGVQEQAVSAGCAVLVQLEAEKKSIEWPISESF